MKYKIEAVLEIISSKPDTYGNTYYAMRVIRTKDGNEAVGTISGGSSNCMGALREMYDSWDSFIVVGKTLSKSDFFSLTANWDYFGCTAQDINKVILSQWEREDVNEIA